MGKIEAVYDEEQYLQEANKCKELGNQAFKQQDWDEALEQYTKAIDLATNDSKEKAVFYKNRAAVYLKQDDYQRAALDCDLALEITPNDPKALFRRCIVTLRLLILPDSVAIVLINSLFLFAQV